MYAKSQKWRPAWLLVGGGNWDGGCIVKRGRLDRSRGIRVQRGLPFKQSKTVSIYEEYLNVTGLLRVTSDFWNIFR